jgi:hypothetical protein
MTAVGTMPVARRGRLFLLGSATLMTKLEEVLGPGVDAT